jgi:hypothetical protein
MDGYHGRRKGAEYLDDPVQTDGLEDPGYMRGRHDHPEFAPDSLR